jgi:ferredoxin
VRVAVDRALCTGHAQCAVVCPSVFDTDEEGYAVVLGGGAVPGGEEDVAALAIDACPEQAISQVDD